MISSRWPASHAAFARFLYAPVGDDGNGMQLTVLSALARRNVDPWEEAALLCRMPVVKARRQLIAMLDALPGQDGLTAQEALTFRTKLAGRLLPLLPHRAQMRALNFA